MPVSQHLPGYRGSTFRRDLLAGLTVAALALPAAMAYANVRLHPRAQVTPGVLVYRRASMPVASTWVRDSASNTNQRHRPGRRGGGRRRGAAMSRGS